MIRTLLFIGAGSFIGGVARYLLARAVQTETSSAFPLGTMVVNLLGCLAIGILYGLFDRGNIMNPELRLFLTVGFCGGFTTFSTFIHESHTLFGEKNFLYFILYSVLSFGLGLILAHFGHWLVKLF